MKNQYTQSASASSQQRGRHLLSTKKSRMGTLLVMVVVVVLVVGIFWLVSRLDIEEIHKEIEQVLETQDQYQITVEDIEWTWLGGFGINLSDVAVQLAETETVIAKIKKIYIDVAIFPLLVGTPEILLHKMNVTGVSLYFEVPSDGGYLWSGAKETSKPKIENLFEALVPTLDASKRKRSEFSHLFFKPDIITIEDVVIDYEDDQRAHRLTLDYVQAQGLQTKPEADVSLRGQFESTNLKPVAFDLSGTAYLPLRGFNASRQQLDDKRIDRRVLTNQGETQKFIEERPSIIDFFTPLNVPWNLTIEQGLLKFFDGAAYDLQQMKINWFDETILLNGRLLSDVKITLKDFIISNPVSDLSWEGDVLLASTDADFLSALPSLPAPVPVKSFSLEGYFTSTEDGLFCEYAAVSLNDETFTGEFRVAFQDVIKVSLRGSGRSMNLGAWFDETETGSKTTLSQSFNSSPLWSKKQTDAINRYRWDLLLHLDRLEFANTALQEVDFSSQFDGDALFVSVYSGQALGGLFNAKLAIDLVPKQPIWQVRFTSNGTDLTELNNWLSLRLGLSGNVDLDGYATLVGSSQAQLLESAKGYVQLSGDSGWFDISSIRNTALKFAAATNEEDIVSNWPAQFRFSYLRASLTMPEGIDTQSIQAQIDGLAFSAQGQFDPFRKRVDLNANFRIQERLYTASLDAISGSFREVSWPAACRGDYATLLPCQIIKGGANQILSGLLNAKARYEDIPAYLYP